MADTAKHTRPHWRVFEDINHGWWGIEIEGDQDGEPILYPIKIGPEKLGRIVEAHNGVEYAGQLRFNRNLIDAAPDLLEALIHATQDLESLGYKADAARAAIAKAEGV